MAGEITTTQVGNVVLPPEDPDYIAPGEPSAEAAEIAAEEAAKEAAARALEDEARARRPRPGEAPRDEHHGTYDAELARLRQQRDRLRADNAERDRQIADLRAEQERWRARQELEREAQERVRRMQHEASRPDPEVDPVGAQMWDMQNQLRQQNEFIQAVQRERQAQQQYMNEQQQTHQMLQEVDRFVDADLKAYRAANPEFNYDEASLFVQKKIVDMWMSTGLTEQQALAVTANQFAAIARSAQMNNQSACATVAQLSRDLGYQQSNGNGRQPAPAANGTQESAAQKITRVNKAQKMQGLGGKTPAERTVAEDIGLISSEQLAEMSDDQYLELKSNPQTARMLEKRLEELG